MLAQSDKTFSRYCEEEASYIDEFSLLNKMEVLIKVLLLVLVCRSQVSHKGPIEHVNSVLMPQK